MNKSIIARNKLIFYSGIGVVVLVAEIGNQYGLGCLAFPLLIILTALTAFVFPMSPEENKYAPADVTPVIE